MTARAQLASTIEYVRSAPSADHRLPLQDGSSCPHCEGERVQKWGGFSGRLRYRCRDCTRTFSTFTDTPLHHLKRPELWPGFLACVEDRLSVRRSGLVLEIDKDTALRWRHRLFDHWRCEPRRGLEGRIVIGDFSLPHSDKGGRYLSRPPRRRGEPWSFPSLQTGPVTVLVALERNAPALSPAVGMGEPADRSSRSGGSRSSAMVIESVGVRRLRSGDYDRRIAPRARDVAEIVGCRGPSGPVAGFARRLGVAYRMERRSFFPREVFLVRREVRGWLRPFRGVATRRLDNYLEWFRRRGGFRRRQQLSPTEPDRARQRSRARPPTPASRASSSTPQAP